ncbi:uncharacterized protein C8A04DRAFT_11310 [Dichotomopilus funicola]|uniref:Gfo/Idh/MocA-like oxidoreductase N-terminal domain-containing protein n=1 Tax=Dichotomopilus funicola TaxID=1934379 RepID=A0AAN6V4H1_9PEZI|nr:hypothetical protein C8A04DRAFT_11310 [Dichotomopilus funicola]
MSKTEESTQAAPSADPPRILIIGAGSRGKTYAKAIASATNGVVAAVSEPDNYKRNWFGEAFIWGSGAPPPEGAAFADWREFIAYEKERRARAASGREENVPPGIDAAFVCVLDEMHRDVVVALANLGGFHIMCEKPLATTLQDCIDMYAALQANKVSGGEQAVFSIGHVLRYSPHNMLLRKLAVQDRVIGDILSVVHTEPVGWWHFSHSYVRGNWRRESTTAPSLLTKSCHDIDVLLWLLCSPSDYSVKDGPPPHLPSSVTSTGTLQYFKRSRKPARAGNATNCLSCPVESDCKYSAKRIYVGPEIAGLETCNTGWPVSIVVPDIESCDSMKEAKKAVLSELAKDYTSTTPDSEVSRRNWFGRCVYECDNDVCDDQVVTLNWEEEPLAGESGTGSRNAKTAVFHMVSHTKKICQRYTHLYGVDGEIYADSTTITVEDFRTGKTTVHRPPSGGAGHGGGDTGLTRQFILAIDKVKNHGWSSDRAQRELVGCTLEEVILSHAMVFCAEAARRGKEVINWPKWWAAEVQAKSAPR